VSSKQRAGDSEFPPTGVLERRVRSCLEGMSDGATVSTIVGRRPNPKRGTHASEFVLARFSDGRMVEFFCKHGKADVAGSEPFRGGLPGGLRYEAAVHETVLRGLVSPALLGFESDPDGSATLFFERLENVKGVSESVPKSVGLCAAARWIGAFHRSSETIPTSRSKLNRYAEPFYAQWFDRAMHFLLEDDVSLDYAGLRRSYRGLVEAMCATECVIHGDYYSDQVLESRGLHVVDWELAAIACGEIDLATITLGRSTELVRQMEYSYVEARWDGRGDDSFSERLLAARLFLLLRLLGVSKDWPNPKKYRRRVRMLMDVVESLGALEQ
jgi:hypothetical protein